MGLICSKIEPDDVAYIASLTPFALSTFLAIFPFNTTNGCFFNNTLKVIIKKCFAY